MTGILYVVGVGPGDPELMTLKAARLIGAADLVAFFSKCGRTGHARRVADGHLAPGVRELHFEYPFTTEIAVENPRYLTDMGVFYEQCAKTLGDELGSGADVVLLCEGDPFFYGSAMYLYDRLRARYRCEIVPGITGMSGCWSRAGAPMTHGDDVLSVLPATLDEDTLVTRLQACDAAVIMKLGSNLAKVRAALDRAGLADRAIYVERGTMEDEIILPFAELTRAKVPYFAIVLIPGRQGAR
jgi:precorrin-2/cobalt-factor-2 C20-methyltransferase